MRGDFGWACLSAAQRSEFAQPPRLTSLTKGSLAVQARPADQVGAPFIRRTPAPKEEEQKKKNKTRENHATAQITRNQRPHLNHHTFDL